MNTKPVSSLLSDQSVWMIINGAVVRLDNEIVSVFMTFITHA